MLADEDLHRVEEFKSVTQQPLLVPQDRHLPPASDDIQPGRPTSQELLALTQPLPSLPDPRLRVPERREQLRVQREGIGVRLVVRADGAGEGVGERGVDLEEGVEPV